MRKYFTLPSKYREHIGSFLAILLILSVITNIVFYVGVNARYLSGIYLDMVFTEIFARILGTRLDIKCDICYEIKRLYKRYILMRLLRKMHRDMEHSTNLEDFRVVVNYYLPKLLVIAKEGGYGYSEYKDKIDAIIHHYSQVINPYNPKNKDI